MKCLEYAWSILNTEKTLNTHRAFLTHMKHNKILSPTKAKKNTYFSLTLDVRDALLSANLTAAEWRIWTYLVSLDPFGDRGAKFSPAELMLKCGVRKTTYFVAKAKFQKLRIFDFQDETTKVFNHYGSASISHFESEIPESESEIPESESEIPELNTMDRARAHPLQTNQTFQTKGVDEFFGQDSQKANLTKLQDERLEEPLKKNQSQRVKIESENEIFRESNSEHIEIPSEISQKLEKYGVNLTRKTEESEFSGIPKDLYEKLTELEIPIDAKVRKAVVTHDLSQAYGAVAHVEKTRSTIQNPRGVFLYQLPKQSVTNRQKSEDRRRKKEAEFLAWYEAAIAEGIVEDVPPQYLSRDGQNQPLVRLKQTDLRARAPYRTEPWQQVRDGKTNYVEPDKNFFKQIREKVEQIKANLKPRNLDYGI